MVKLYDHRDVMALNKHGNVYVRHVEAMTAEGLHSKSDIAAELAWRDVKLHEANVAVHNLIDAKEALEAQMAVIREWYGAEAIDALLFQRPADSASVMHASDCAVHNEPALPVGPCNCGAAP